MSVIYMIIGLVSGLVAAVILGTGNMFGYGEGRAIASAVGAGGFALAAGLCFIASAIAYSGEARELRDRKKDQQ